MICVEVDPDRPLRFDLGGTSLVPGECAVGPEGEPSRGRRPHRGGLVRVAVDDGRDGATDHRWIRARRGTTTWIGVRSDQLWIRVERRQRCDQLPPS